ncbi:MAG: ATP-binding protein [Ignavibacteria bacterium]
MKDLSLHILDIAENSIEAGAKNIGIIIDEDISNDLLTLEINDDGRGMDAEYLEKVTDPFVTTRTTRKVGLGISLLKAAAESANGKLIINSTRGIGTVIKATFQLTHIDRKPVGMISDTILTLVVGNPDINFNFQHLRNGFHFTFNSGEVKEKLFSKGLNSTEILTAIRKILKEYSINIKT